MIDLQQKLSGAASEGEVTLGVVPSSGSISGFPPPPPGAFLIECSVDVDPDPDPAAAAALGGSWKDASGQDWKRLTIQV